MADGTDGPVGSGAMEATPAVDPAFGHHHDPESLVEALEMEPTEVAPISLGRRLTQPRTILSIVVPLAIIGFFLYLNRERLAAVPSLILQANPALVLLAAIVFYLGFPLRGYRWQRLLRETGFIIGLRNSTEILYISWFVNCVVPAKLGDVYRAYLLKMNSDASLSRTFGTVFIERILDIFAIAILGLAAGFWSFRLGMPPADPDHLRRRHRDRGRGRRRPVHDAQLRAPDPDPAAAPAADPGAVRAVRGGRVRGRRARATCRCWRS